MRKLGVTTLFIVLFCGMFAVQQTDHVMADVFQNSSSASDYTEMTFSLPEITIDDMVINGVVYQQLSHPLAGATRELGYPELPTFSAMLAVPAGADVSIELVSEERVNMGEMLVSPAQPLDSDATSPVSIATSVYNDHQAWTPDAVQVSETAIMRDFHLVVCTVNPFLWDPATGAMTARSSMTIRVHHDHPVTPPSTISRSFEPMYRSVIANYDNIMRDVEPDYQPRSMIVIRPAAGGIDDEIEQYIEWKRTKGFIVYEYTASASSNSIRDYLRNAYETWEIPPEYVVIIGDVNGNYSCPTFYESAYSGASDHPYGCLAGDDLLPEAFVGRISVNTTNEFLTYLSKLNLYERNTYMDNPDFYHQSLLVGDTSPSGISCMLTNLYIKDLILQEDGSHSFTELYGASPSPSQMDNAINAGALFFNYRGWEGTSGWGISNIESLTNINELCNSVILTCGTGAFANGESRTEALIREGSYSEPRGAITAIGMSTSATHTRFNNILSGGIFYGLFTDRMNNMGEALMRGKLALYTTFQSTEPNEVHESTYWCNLMGDPTLQVWRTEPKIMNASHSVDIPLGQTWLDVMVTDALNQPLADAWVTARQGDNFTASDYADENGMVTLHFENGQSGDVDLTITRGDYKPILDEFEIISNEISGCSFESYTLVEQNGNGDNQPNPGESFEMDITLHNYSNAPNGGLSGVMSCDSEYIEITTAEQNFETLPSGGSGSSVNPFGFSIYEDAPDRYEARFNIAITDGADNWDVSCWVVIQGTDLDIIGWTVIDGGNGVLDPGETTLLTFSLENSGVYGVNGVEVELMDYSDMLNLIDSLAVLGDVAPGETVSTGVFELTASEQLITGMNVGVTLRMTTPDGYIEEERCELPIGVVTIDDPLGPDNYGYICYDDGDTAYEDAPEYEWIEINPAYGGMGIDTGINDASYQEDENAYIDLPFTFNFYGVAYDEITVSSNGWIAFGETETVSFRPCPLPGPLGPSPQVAAFWTDLLSTSVYTYMDCLANAFIIEWSDCLAQYGTGISTFQILLYDPLAYPTSTGDGMIKVQYAEVSEIEFGVGIEDHTSTNGMQYAFNDEYPTAARAIEPERALLYTPVPISHDGPYLGITDYSIYDSNGNGCVEPGETIQLGCLLNNSGQNVACDVTATLSSNNPLVTIIDGTADYPDIDPNTNAYSLDFYSLSVDAAAQNNDVLSLSIHIECSTGSWVYPINLRVYKPNLTYQRYLVFDGLGNGNGLIDPGETVTLAVNIFNDSPTLAVDATASLSTTSPYVTITNSTCALGDIDPETVTQCVYELELSSTTPLETTIPLQIDLTLQNAEPTSHEFGFTVSDADAILYEDFSQWPPEGWTFEGYLNWWHNPNCYAGGTAPEVRLAFSPIFNGAAYLVTPELYLLGYSNVSFKFTHTCWVFDPVNYPFQMGLAMRANGSDWEILWEMPGSQIEQQLVEIEVDSDLLNQPNAQFALYIDGHSLGFSDWYIDNISVNATFGSAAKISGELSLVGGGSTPDTGLVSIGDMRVHPDENGQYTLYAPACEYDGLSGSDPFYTTETITDISLNYGQTLQDQDFELHWLAPADSLCISFDDEESLAMLNWQYTEPEQTRKGRLTERSTPVDRQTFEEFRIWRRRDTSEFVLVDSTTAQEWSEVIDTLHTNTYYVTVKYAEGVSDSTTHVDTSEWVPNAIGGEVNPYTDWLGSNYPNPFNPTTTFRFSIAEPGDVKLKIYNVRGQLVRTLVNETMEAGGYEITWHGDDSHGNSVATGVYLYRLETPRKTLVRKSLLLK